MALTVEDLRDLVELLQAHPEWREVLWALLASEDLLRLPADLAAFRAEAERRFAELAEAVRRLSEAFVAHRQELLAQQAQTEARFAELSAAVRVLVETQGQLVEAQGRTEENLQRLSEAFVAHRQELLAQQAQTEARFAELSAAVRVLVETQGQLVEAQGRTEENLQRLSEAFVAHRQELLAQQAQTEARFAELAEAVRRLSEEFAAHRQEFQEHRQEFLEHRREFLEHRQEFLEYRAQTDRRLDRVEARLDRVERRQEDHSRDLGELKSMRLEALYRENPGLFRPLLRRAAILPDSRKLEILEEAEAAGRITGEEVDRAAPLDLLVEGFHRRGDRRVYLAVEVSWLGSTEDVARAAERAGVLARALGAEVVPVVAAKALTAPARRAARERGVWWLRDGRAFAPEEIPEEEEEPGSEAA